MRFIKYLLFFLLLCLSQALVAPQDSLLKEMDEVIIYTNKFAERKKNIVQKIDVVSAQRIAQMNAQNTGDLLINTGNVFVQKSQQGGSSTVLRGFEASRVLLVIDGIRMNNAIYRSGHLQNIITTDQNSLEQVEILYGPGSTLYGSDALGGVILLRTKNPKLAYDGDTKFTGSAFARYSSANNEKTVHADVSIGGKKWAWLQAYNFSDFGDMKMGRHYPKEYPDFGRRTFYITQINGIDSVVKNRDDRVQKFSGYQQWDVTQKVLFRPSEKTSHLLNLQLSNSTNVPRYDRLQDVKNGTLRFADWYYGPQLRTLAAYEIARKKFLFFNEAKTTASYQYIEESRHQREFRRYDRLDNRFEKLSVLALTSDARKLWKQHELTVGIDGQWNFLASTAFRKDINTGAEKPLDTRYPNGHNRMHYYGAYAQHLYKFGNNKWILNDGLRVQYVTLHSTIADNSFFNFPFAKIDQQNGAITGNIGLVHMPNATMRISFGLASGFRAPNIDDAAKIFESNTASKQLIIPNPDIKPEYTYNADMSFLKSFKKVRIEATCFYTLFKNAIALAPYTYGHQDSFLYNGTMSKVYAAQNVARAHVYGFSASLVADVMAHLRWSNTINYTHGVLKNKDESEVPLDHIPPVYGRSSFAFSKAGWNADFYALYNGWKRIKDYNPSGEDNAQYATPDGTPAWFTLNLKASVPLHKNLIVQAGVENILDRNYRYFASGFSAPGRNYILALRAQF